VASPKRSYLDLKIVYPTTVQWIHEISEKPYGGLKFNRFAAVLSDNGFITIDTIALLAPEALLQICKDLPEGSMKLGEAYAMLNAVKNEVERLKVTLAV
jgi:hypothetical protein